MPLQIAPSIQVSIPSFFLCPISLQLMEDPVTLSTGQTFDRSSIEKWLDEGHLVCPLTRQPLQPDEEPIPNHTLRRMIQGWCVANRSKGIQRIATPREPATSAEVRQLVREINSGEPDLRSLKKVNVMAREQLRSSKHLLEAGVLSALASCLTRLSAQSSPKCSWVQHADEILSILAFLCDTQSAHWNPTLEHVSTIALFLVKGSIDSKLNATMLLKSVELSQEMKKGIGARDGVMGSLVAMVKEDLSPRVSLAGLKLLCDLVSFVGNRARAVEAGAVEVVVELLLGADKRSAELGLGLLEALCLCAEGRAAVCNHALSIPVIVTMTNSISEKATEHALQILSSVLTMRTTRLSVKKMAVEAGAVHQVVMAPLRCSNSASSRKLALQILRALGEAVDLSTCHLQTAVRL